MWTLCEGPENPSWASGSGCSFDQRTSDAYLGVGHQLPQEPIVAEHHEGGFGGGWFRGPHAGDRAPDAGPLKAMGVGTASLFDILCGTKHTLLFAGVEPNADTWKRLDMVAEQVRDRYGTHIQVYQVTTGNTPSVGGTSDGELLQDPELALHHRYGAHSECLYLVRSDGYVGFRSRPASSASFQDYLRRIFI